MLTLKKKVSMNGCLVFYIIINFVFDLLYANACLNLVHMV